MNLLAQFITLAQAGVVFVDISGFRPAPDWRKTNHSGLH